MDVRNKQAGRVIITLTSFVIGLLFYLYYRPDVLAINLGMDIGIGIDLPISLWAAFPSFIFMPLISGITIIILRILGTSTTGITLRSIGIWLAIVLLFELLQATHLAYLARGTFDWLDIIAAILGSALAVILFAHPLSNKEISAPVQSWKLAPVLLLGSGAILGSYPSYCDGDSGSEMCINRVTLSWEDIRTDIQPDLSGSEVLERSGKIYSYDHWLLVVEKYRGIHIFDTRDKLNPIRKMYIPIPGALDITIKGGMLYSSAFTDLVTIDLNLLLQSEGLDLSYSRQEELFSYPPAAQFYPDSYYRNFDDTPANEVGVVIGYKTKSGKIILYGDDYDLAKEESAAETEAKKDDKNTTNDGCLLLPIWMC
jgi:hypothetical protein